ncbi:MAG: UvrD-helicase domain-containing protein [Treponema sp.]|nr:UvrD-helicase domain-containing protein [Treponema sp.]
MNIKTTNVPELNQEQKNAVFCENNAVVAAGAGSGKTMVLANRFIWLLTEKGYKVDEILTLTFTKKAAAEMFRRIHSLLSFHSKNETGKKRERTMEALDNFIHARIQTLDSYSTALVKQCASRYGISPDFEINPQRNEEIALEESLPFLIKHRHHPAIERLYANNRPNDITQSIFQEILVNYCRIDMEIDFSSHVILQFDIICAEWEKQINKITAIIDELEKQKSVINEMCPNLVPVMESYKNKNIKFLKTQEIREFFNFLLNEDITLVIEKAESHPIQILLLQLLYFISDLNNVNTIKGKPASNPVKENVKQIKSLYEKFSSLVLYCKQAGFIISFMSLLNDLQKRYILRKRAEGILTFNDIANLSRTILLEQLDIRQSEKETFKAIMIDEFQDNNELQKDLLFLLAEKSDYADKSVPKAENLSPGKLFFVGDEKQSIYLFRGADVSVFRKLQLEIKGAYLPLKINYRSVPALIGAFNAIFGGSYYDPEGKKPLHNFSSIFAPGLSEQLPLYEAAYSPLEAKNKGEGELSICILNGNDENSDMLDKDENEARFTAKKIKQLLEETTEEGEKKYQPKDIAILFRSHGPQYLFEKHLRLLEIPYECENINDLFYGGVVNDIMSVLRLAAYPLDTMAYAEMLRSPFAGLSISGAAACISILKRTKNDIPFSETPLSCLDNDDREKYINGQKVYSSICQKAAKMSISSLISELWYNEGYRYETEWHPNTQIYREYYDYLFHLASRADEENQGLAAFTDYLCNLKNSGERLRDIDIPLDRSGAVHLMTIHKSKGLEYPVVFICCCGKYSRRNQSKNVYLSDDAGLVLCPPMPQNCHDIPDIKKNIFWEQIKAAEKHKRTAELRRLLYVAMTRAEEKLFLTGVLSLTGEDEIDDFFIKVKTHIDKKCEKKENHINGDSILDDDTFFGLILPVITSNPSSGFFTLEEIPFYLQESISNETKKTDLKYNQEGLNAFFNRKKNLYEKAEIIKTPVLYDNHITPVSLKKDSDETTETAGRDFYINKEYSGSKSDDIFSKVDTMLMRFSQNSDENNEKFNFGSFGTIAHICVEALLNKTEAVIPSNISGLLSPLEFKTLLEAGKELAIRFMASPLGIVAQNASLKKSEFAFRSILKNKNGKEIFINGSIDLFFEDTDTFHIVDFKTDKKEIPGEHTAQLSCYYHAVSALFADSAKKQCRTWLYYLRTGHAVEVTEKAKGFNLEQRAFLML